MARGLFVTGTDTGAGKTVVSALLVRVLEADYWKPVQSGIEGEPDADTVARLAGAGPDRIHPSTYSLRQPRSPHEAARRDGVRIELERFALPRSERPLVVEGAGGVLVPLNESALMVDLMSRLALPVVLAARSGLGTINHTLLSLRALRERGLRVLGVVLSGPQDPANKAAIEHYGEVHVIAEVPWLEPLGAASLERTARRKREQLVSILKKSGIV